MKPLQHVTILDLSRVLACPFAGMILAELGVVLANRLKLSRERIAQLKEAKAI